MYASVWDSVGTIDPALFIPIFAVIGGVLIALTAIVSMNWRKARQSELDAALKQDMLNRGFTAADIERVINARK